MLKTFPKENLCSNVGSKDGDNRSCDLQLNKAKPYSMLKIKDHYVAISKFSVSDSMFSYDLNDSL